MSSPKANSREKDLQIVVRSPPFTLPDGWLVERHRRISPNPGHAERVDKYYIEPNTRQKFRSLVSVQRYLNEEPKDYLPAERMISRNKNTTRNKSRRKQKFPRDFEGGDLTVRDFKGARLAGENACRPTPKIIFKCSGKRSAPTTQTPIQSVSEETHSRKKAKLGKDGRGSIHNSTRPPTKVRWVLSGPSGFWNPFLDDSMVPASEKAKWSKAFSISINEGVTN
ncbi:methyl-CpG-binding domain-containing protein 7-like [Vicia villosa]|uniref:methyl-CpG-binding domain-containing protein 7-like n=1 Tax=Vicia villosa TaxID=3911 RepID=UPI00273C86D5|nr:methyl-CpG-binding domain-containing protein 7-like [Vicia villosa]